MSKTVTRTQARTWTLGAQIASVVLVAGAVGVGIIGLPEPAREAALSEARARAEARRSMDSALGGENGGAENAGLPLANADIDTGGLAARLALVDNAPTPVAPPVQAQEPDEGEADDPQPGTDNTAIVKRVRYIGFINDPDTRHAFIRIDGKQRIVGEGEMALSGDEALPDLRLERVTSQRIILSDGERRAGVRLAAKGGQSVTMIDGGEVQVAEDSQNTDGSLTPEEEALIDSLPPRQQPRARRRLEREKRGLPPDREVRRPTPEPLVSVRSGINRSQNQPSRRERGED